MRKFFALVCLLFLSACQNEDKAKSVYVSGSVSGFGDNAALGVSATLTLNDSSSVVINGDGPFSFPDPLKESDVFAVVVSAQSDSLNCRVINGTGEGIASGDVTTVTVTCQTLQGYSLNGFITGVTTINTEDRIDLVLNDLETLSVNVNGAFSFKTPQYEGRNFNVKISNQPSHLKCAFRSETDAGIMHSNTPDVSIECADVMIGFWTCEKSYREIRIDTLVEYYRDTCTANFLSGNSLIRSTYCDFEASGNPFWQRLSEKSFLIGTTQRDFTFVDENTFSYWSDQGGGADLTYTCRRSAG